MPCNCEEQKTHEQDGNGNGNGNGNGDKGCGPGQKMVDGKCVPNPPEKKKEQLGDPKTDSTQGALPPQDAGDQPSDVSGEPCGENSHWDATSQMCVPNDTKDPGDGQTQGTDATASVESLVKMVKNLESKLLPTVGKKPTAVVAASEEITEFKSISEIAREFIPALRKYGKYEFNIPLEYFRSITVGAADPKMGVQEAYRGMPISLKEAYRKPNKTIKEAVTITGTHATQDLDTDVAIVPGGISFIPVFQFAKVKQIEQGFDRARFFKSTIPANGTQTKGSAPSEATQTITSIEVTPSTITGVYLIGDYDEIENSPFDLLQTIVEGSAASYDDFVGTDMLTTVSAEGTLTPGLWIRGDTGATITSSDIASNAMDETGIAYGREYLENQGYLRGGIKPVCVLHPRQWRELVTSTNVTALATRSVPDIWLKAQLEELFGVQLVVSNAVENETAQTNNAYNALMFIPKHSYGIGVKRDVTVKFHDIGENNEVRVNTSWRTKSGVIDATSIVRISTTAP